MVDKIGKGILIAVLTIGVLVGAYLGYTRYFVELQERTVELCVDLNDVKRMVAVDNRPLGPVLDEIRKRGIVSVGVFEETLPDANALGEIYSAKGSGVMHIKLNPLYCKLGKKGKIKLPLTYIYAPHDNARKRISSQLRMVLNGGAIKFYDKDKLEVNAAEEELRGLGLGLSELQKNFIYKKGFRIIPRVWNDERYHRGNIPAKIAALKEFDTIIFDGEEILGYPDALKETADELRKHNIRYGYIEIVKQDGDKKLRRLMGRNMIRVHSVPKEELKKLKVDTVLKRFVRAARERKVKLIYVRPFLPPQVVGDITAFNLDYFSAIKQELEQGGFVLGKAQLTYPLDIKAWQILLLGIAVLVGAAFLLNYFIRIPIVITFLGLILLGCAMVVLGVGAGGLLLQKGLALLAAITFPSLAVISTFAVAKKAQFSIWNTILMALNIIAETLIGVFLVMGLLADYRFTLGIEVFSGVKLALIMPILIVALYFILQQGEGTIRERVRGFLNIDVKLAAVFVGLFILGALGIFVARSGNFVLPVPGFEKVVRVFLEGLFFIRPRTKEFLIGYPFLFLAATLMLRGKHKWLWVLAAIGTIAPVSVFNTFCHIHTPVIVSMVRTINGLALGIIIGVVVSFIADKLIK